MILFLYRPIKSEKYPKLDSTSNLATSLTYLDRLYNEKLRKLNDSLRSETVSEDDEINGESFIYSVNF